MLTLFLWLFCVEEDVADPNIVGEGFDDYDDVFNNRPHNHDFVFEKFIFYAHRV